MSTLGATDSQAEDGRNAMMLPSEWTTFSTNQEATIFDIVDGKTVVR